MCRKLIVTLFIPFVIFFCRCGEVSTNLKYHKGLAYKHKFTYNGPGSYIGHVVSVKELKKKGKITDQQLEELALIYVNTQLKQNDTIDYIRFVNNEFAQKEEVDQYRLATIYVIYKNSIPEIKEFIRDQR